MQEGGQNWLKIQTGRGQALASCLLSRIEVETLVLAGTRGGRLTAPPHLTPGNNQQ